MTKSKYHKHYQLRQRTVLNINSPLFFVLLSFLFAIIFIFLLTACSPQNNGSTDIEMKLVDENLKLKEEIFDLEHELEETIEKEREEQVIESRILSFFYYINEGNREEAERRTTDKIHGTAPYHICNIIFA